MILFGCGFSFFSDVRGDTEFHVETGMVISGAEKYVQALAHVINFNNALWESGFLLITNPLKSFKTFKYIRGHHFIRARLFL